MDKHLSYKERMNRVDEVMEDLGLIKCANTVIGDAAKGSKGISGGERKRLAFASEVSILSLHPLRVNFLKKIFTSSVGFNESTIDVL